MSQHHKKRLEELLQNLNDAVYTVDLSGKFSSVNPAGEEMTGYLEKDLLKMNFGQIIAPEYLDLVRKKIAQKTKKNVSTIYEIEIIRKDGKRVPIEISSRAIYEDGKPVEILGIARDISERKQLDEQKEVFISLITHELKNPLTTIKLSSEILKRKLAKKESIDEYLDTIFQEVDTLTNLANDFLEVSKVRFGKFLIKKQKTNLNMLIAETIKPFLIRHKIEVRGEKLREVDADSNRIKQVLVNFLSNAIKYSLPGEKIVIFTKKEKGRVVVGVKDFGLGISHSDQKRIFDLFYRVNSTGHNKISGHGLGLFICKEIIKSHKGKIWVESEVGKGSTFFFSLPSI